jgi:hypothetical protein
MKDTTFYQAMFYCYRPVEGNHRNCKHCPLYAQGKFVNDECQRMLFDELRHRKCEALKKDEED